MPPRGKAKSTPSGTRFSTPGADGNSSFSGSPAPSSYIDRNTYFDVARPFKSAAWERKKAARTGKTKTTKQILQAERDRGARHILEDGTQGEMLGYTTLHPPPSLLPAKKYCDITGLEAPYRDPKTGLQFHSKEIYGVIRTLVGPYLVSRDLAHRLTLAPVCFSLTPQPPGVDQQYLMLRGRGSAIV